MEPNYTCKGFGQKHLIFRAIIFSPLYGPTILVFSYEKTKFCEGFSGQL